MGNSHCMGVGDDLILYLLSNRAMANEGGGEEDLIIRLIDQGLLDQRSGSEI